MPPRSRIAAGRVAPEGSDRALGAGRAGAEHRRRHRRVDAYRRYELSLDLGEAGLHRGAP